METTKNLKTWIEIDSRAVAHNVKTFRRRIAPTVKLWSVVKSNAYGHGLFDFVPLADRFGVDGFCVDSVIEGLKLREQGITKPILVFGPTLGGLLKRAKEADLTITVSSLEAFSYLAKSSKRPDFHLKIDTGMRRQGFFPDNLKHIAERARRMHLPLKGIYTHFAAAKDLNYPTFTDFQFHAFRKATEIVRTAGFKDLISHAASSGGALMRDEFHLDAVRVGGGLYGLWPSRELGIQLEDSMELRPALSWHVIISEIKRAAKGDYVGYDLTERIPRATTIAILPIGYWHGFDRGLSSRGNVLIHGRLAKVLGRVSMDLTVVDVGNIKCRVGDRATIIGGDAHADITARDIADQCGTIHYEILTRINPLIQRVIV